MELLRDTIKKIIILSNLFNVNSGYFILFIFAIIFLIKYERKNALVYRKICLLSIGILLAIYNPIIVFGLDKVARSPERYVRIFWLLPMVVVLAYVSVRIMEKVPKEESKNMMKVLLVLGLVFAGKSIINSNDFHMTQNWYKLPQEVLEICDIFPENTTEYKIVADPSVSAYIRQYDGRIKMLYGRYNAENLDIYKWLQSNPLEISLITRHARVNYCQYIVLDKRKEWSDQMEAWGYELRGETENYAVYKDVWNDEERMRIENFRGSVCSWTGNLYVLKTEGSLMVYNRVDEDTCLLVQECMLDAEGIVLYDSNEDVFQLVDENNGDIIHEYKEKEGLLYQKY